MNDKALIKNVDSIRDKSKVLFCLPFAGGGASAFGAWIKELREAHIVVCPIQLPGREEKIMEAPYTDMKELIRDLLEQIEQFRDYEIYLFGHSMGAKLAYEVAKGLEQEQIKVRKLIVSGSRVVHIPEPNPICRLPDKEFEEEIARFEGTPKEILENKELLAFFLPMLRADFTMDETYYVDEIRKLNCPIVAFGGIDDQEADEAAISRWTEYTDNDFGYQMFSGNHFFIRDYEEDVLLSVKRAIAE